MPSSSSSARQALDTLAFRLRGLRLDAGLTGRDLATLANWHSSKVSKIEHSRQTPSAEDIRLWCLSCNAVDQIDELVHALQTAEGMFVQWQQLERDGLRRAQESVLPIWERTMHFRIYSSWLIPGPLQTQSYIRAILGRVKHMRHLDDDIEDAIRVRLDKQAVIHQKQRRFAIILEESVLQYPIGGSRVMVDQLGYLLSVATLPAVSLGIIPLGADRSLVGPAEGFWMFDDKEVTVELVSGHLTVTQSREVAAYGHRFSALASLAVYGNKARPLIARALSLLES
ncbi:helix-turn-helix transcriptional regulator [Sphaerisporangium sp. NPDC051011]|uniref:helix-turn-helix domain-containing protein n=1 Tax=Sphaerisporangium sp. NPDC051011 TaxID=3155792 RepID=UPI0033E3CBDA